MTSLKPFRFSDRPCVTIVAPSSSCKRSDTRGGVELLQSIGVQIKWGRAVFNKKDYLAGSDLDRAHDVLDALASPDSQAVMTTRGGYGCQRLIPFLDRKLKKSPRKIILGYSDFTTLHLYLFKRFNLVTFIGPGITLGGHDPHRATISALTDFCLGRSQFDFHIPHAKIFRPGVAQGLLVGGCLTLVNASLGTHYEADFARNIAFFEDVHEAPYKIDRMLTQLVLAKKFDKCQGIVFGNFTGLAKPAEYYRAIDRAVGHLKIPIMYGLPIGHGPIKKILPHGAAVEINTGKKNLKLIEEPWI